MKYREEEYFSVIDSRTGKKIVDCSSQIDALMMISFDPQNRVIIKNNFLMSVVIDVEQTKQLPTSQIAPVSTQNKSVNKLKPHKNKLPKSELQPLKF